MVTVLFQDSESDPEVIKKIQLLKCQYIGIGRFRILLGGGGGGGGGGGARFRILGGPRGVGGQIPSRHMML